jgi:hypothetical protein
MNWLNQMFFFKRREIVVDCFINDVIIFNNFKIQRAGKFIPKEWKGLPSYHEIKISHNLNTKMVQKVPTLKRCNAFRDLFANGFIIPLWADIQLEAYDSQVELRGHKIIEPNVRSEWHSRSQIGDFYPNYNHIKLESPWRLREKIGVQFSWNGCLWNNTHNLENVQFLPGVLDFKYQSSTHINLFVKKDVVVKYFANDPMVHLIPLSDNKIKLKHHLLSEAEYMKISEATSKSNSYNNPRDLRTGIFPEKKCPFGFVK